MKQVAVGRKNWLFVGSVSAGYRSMDLMTLVSSAVRNDLDVRQYLTGVMTELLAGVQDYDRLLPHRWAEAHPEQIRRYRQEERIAREENKQVRRARRRKAPARPRR